MKTITHDFLQQGSCDTCLPLHAAILADLQTQLNADHTVKSHLFHGRYENVYIAVEHIRGLQQVITFLQQQAAILLDVNAKQLQLGFWFNIMQHGDITTLHSHDDNDELLSGTYYLQMPSGSGKLLLHQPQQVLTIEPEAGRYVFFHPAVSHEVTAHASDIPRISLGFNLGYCAAGN